MSNRHVWYDKDKKEARDFLNMFREELDEQRKTRQLENTLLQGIRIILIKIMDNPEREFKAADLHSSVRSTVQYFPVKAFIQRLESDGFITVRTQTWSVNSKVTTYVSLNPSYAKVIQSLGVDSAVTTWLKVIMADYLAIITKFALDEGSELLSIQETSDDD